jgi:hypothetical protein
MAQCRTNRDTAAVVISMAESQLSNTDSTTIVSKGLPYKPTSVTLVTTAATCTSVINAFNALFPNSRKNDRISSTEGAYVVKAGTAYALYRVVPAGDLGAIFFFNSAFQYKMSATALQ